MSSVKYYKAGGKPFPKEEVEFILIGAGASHKLSIDSEDLAFTFANGYTIVFTHFNFTSFLILSS